MVRVLFEKWTWKCVPNCLVCGVKIHSLCSRLVVCLCNSSSALFIRLSSGFCRAEINIVKTTHTPSTIVNNKITHGDKGSPSGDVFGGVGLVDLQTRDEICPL